MIPNGEKIRVVMEGLLQMVKVEDPTAVPNLERLQAFLFPEGADMEERADRWATTMMFVMSVAACIPEVRAIINTHLAKINQVMAAVEQPVGKEERTH